jgi:hypothetical protein
LEADYAAALGLLDAQTYEVRKTAHGGNAGHEWRTTLYSPDGTFPELVSPLTASPSLADYELSISSVTSTAKEEFALHYGGESNQFPSVPVPLKWNFFCRIGFDDISVCVSVETGVRSHMYK